MFNQFKLFVTISLILFSCSSKREFSQIEHTRGFYYKDFKQHGYSFSLLYFYELRSEKNSTDELSSEFISMVRKISESNPSKKYFQQKLGGPKLGFELCDEDNCECFILVNWALINLSERKQIVLEEEEVEKLRKLAE